MNIAINWSTFNCKACGGPLADEHVSRGAKSNRINSLGAQLTDIRRGRKFSGRWTIPFTVLDIFVELANLGASVDSEGFVRTD